MKLVLDEVRRLTGPNILWQYPGAILDVLIQDIEPQEVAQHWQGWARRCLDEFGWAQQGTITRLYQGGASLAISAPLDALYTACDLAELSWNCTVAELFELDLPDWQSELASLQNDLQTEVNPQLLAMIRAAQDHDTPYLVDDDEISLGLGTSARVWSVNALPDLQSIEWKTFSGIPTALITGTNGKSTSVRLAAEIAKAAQKVPGVTSTDFIRVGDDILDHGDYSGPGGARIALRDSRTEIAFLEVARGGILRRGLPIDEANAALVTNVASDHLGQYGINTVQELAQAKFVVAKALHGKSVLVVNADNALVVEQAKSIDQPLCWFAIDEANPQIQRQLQSGGKAVFVRGGQFIYHADGLFENIAVVKDVPMTFGGTAQHNIENALGVIGLCRALKLPFSAIRAGLQTFSSDAQDNPGRGNRYHINGCEVIVDFAHNEHSMRAVVSMVRQIPASRRIAMFSHAGDRSDQDIVDLSNAVADLGAEHYIVAELPDYLRGRDLGDIPTIASKALHLRGMATEDISITANPLDGARRALELANPGDVLLLFVLDQRQAVHEWLQSLAAESPR